MAQRRLNRKIVVVGGGTGGHIIPALAVAEALKQSDWQVTFIGSQTGPEEDLAQQAGLPFLGIQAGKLRRYWALANLTDFFRAIIGFWQARAILAKLKPAAVFAKGGYVSLPVIYAAAFLEIPVVVHESDAVIGLANRLAAVKAATICTGWPIDYYPEQEAGKLRFTGNPVRPIFLKAPTEKKTLYKPFGFTPQRPVILVVGGSQGAHPINQLVFAYLKTHLAAYQIIHLTGLYDISEAKGLKSELPPILARRYQPFSHLVDELPMAMMLADMVVTRAGASVLAELAILAKPALVVPLPGAAGDHQRANAAVLRQKGAAIVAEQTALTPKKLATFISKLLKDKAKLQELSRAIQIFASPRSAAIIAEIVAEVATNPPTDQP